MKKSIMFSLTFLLIVTSCNKERNEEGQFESKITMTFNDSNYESLNQTFSSGLSSYLNYQLMPGDIILAFTSTLGAFNISLRERYIIDDLKNPINNINRFSNEGGLGSNYKPTQDEFEKIFRLGSENIVSTGNFTGRESGVIIYYQDENGYYVSCNDNISAQDSSYFIIDEFRKIQSYDAKDQLEIHDLAYNDLYYVEARFNLKLVDKNNLDTIIIKDAKVSFYAYN